MTDRQQYIDGLRQIANLLEAHPDAPLPWYGSDASTPMLVVTTTAPETVGALKCYGGQFTTKYDVDRFENRIGGVYTRVMLPVKV